MLYLGLHAQLIYLERKILLLLLNQLLAEMNFYKRMGPKSSKVHSPLQIMCGLSGTR